jgi:uncharacterized protein (TIGR02466 family)
MANKLHLWPTEIIEIVGDLNLERLWFDCLKHKEKYITKSLSNVGGYQGHEFYSKELFDFIEENLPEEIDVKTIIQAWVNINEPGDWNSLHDHNGYDIVLSGIFYVSVPPNSGDLMFFDQRFVNKNSPYYKHYLSKIIDSSNVITFKPKPNYMLLFPPNLLHMVGPNLSQDTRCSVAFNIVVER